MVRLDLQSRTPIYEQLKARLLEMTALGVLKPDEQIPSVRTMARELGINPNTVSKAYQQLEKDGVIYSVSGIGSFISQRSGWETSIRTSMLERLTGLLQEAKNSGISYQDVSDTVKNVFEE